MKSVIIYGTGIYFREADLSKKISLFIFFIFILLPVFAADNGDYIKDELLISFHDCVSFSKAEEIMEKEGLRVMRGIKQMNGYLVKIAAASSAPEVKARLEKNRSIKYVSFNRYVKTFMTYTPMAFPNDSLYQAGASAMNLWHLSKMQVDRAWNETAGNMSSWSRGITSTVICVIDTGLNTAHVDLANKFLTGWDIVLGTTNTPDTMPHGTYVGSLAAGQVNNGTAAGTGIAGVAVNPKIRPVKVDNGGLMSTANIIMAIYWAADNGAHVINMSLGQSTYEIMEQVACNYAIYTKGCVVVAGSGNDGSPLPFYPAGLTDVISVGSAAENDERSDFSNYSSNLGLVASGGNWVPAENLYMAGYSGTTSYGSGAGTSLTSPLVAGLAAVLMSNGVSNMECFARIARTCDKVGSIPYAVVAGKDYGTRNNEMGYGRMNFYECMKTLVPPENLAITGSSGKCGLLWEAAPLYHTPVSGYNIYRSADAEGPFLKINASVVAGLSYDDWDVDSGQTYYYYVKAVDSDSFETKAGNTVSVVITGVAATKTNTPTVTRSYTASMTYTITPTRTFTNTVTRTFTGTGTFTATPSITATGTRTPLPTLAPTNGCVIRDISFDTDGMAVSNIGLGTERYSYGNDMIIDAAGKLYIGGARSGVTAGRLGWAIWKYNPNGTLDTGFDAAGYVTYDGDGTGANILHGLAFDNTGRIIAAGIKDNLEMHWMRYLTDGWLELETGMSGSAGPYEARDVAVDGSDRVIITGSVDRDATADIDQSMRTWRYLNTGLRDTAGFSPVNGYVSNYNASGSGLESDDMGSSVAVDAAGKIVIAGRSGIPTTSAGFDMVIWRYNTNGTIDASFNAVGYVTHNSAAGGSGNDAAYKVIIDRNNKIVVAGESYGANGGYDMAVWRFNNDGTPDTAFNGTGYFISDGAAGGGGDDGGYGIVQDANGRYLICGDSINAAGDSDMIIWRLNENGSLDTTFNGTGVVTTLGIAAGAQESARVITIDGTGRIVTAGSASDASGDENMAVWRFVDSCGFMTPTNTLVISKTFTPTRSATVTQTPSYTRTVSRTSTNTPTYTATQSMSATKTGTPSVTLTGTNTASVTVTVPSATASVYYTATNTQTQITDSPTATLTETNTFSATVTATVINTYTITATATGTDTVSHTATATIVNSSTLTATSTPVYSSTLTATGTPPTGTNTPTITMTLFLTNTFTPVNTRTVTAGQSFTPSVTASPSESETFTATLSPAGTITLTVTPTLTAVNSPTAGQTNTSTELPTAVSTATNTPGPSPMPTMTQTLTVVPVASATVEWEDTFRISEILIFPNPHSLNSGDLKVMFDISSPADEITVKVYTVSYRLVLKYDLGASDAMENTFIIPEDGLSGFSTGVYFLTVSGRSKTGEKHAAKPGKFVVFRR